MEIQNLNGTVISAEYQSVQKTVTSKFKSSALVFLLWTMVDGLGLGSH